MAQTPMHDFVDGETVTAAMLTPLKANITDHESRLSTVETSSTSNTSAISTETTRATTAEATKAAKTTTITAGTGLTGGGDLSANRTLTVAYGSTSGTAAQGNDSRITITQDVTKGNSALDTRVTSLESKTNGEIKWTKTDATQTTNSTSPATIGSSQSVSVGGTSSRLVIIANFDIGMATANTTASVGGTNALSIKCLIDGTAQTEQLVFASQAVWRGTAGQTWVVTGLSSGSHTVSFTATCTGTGVTYTVTQTHTGATIMVFN